MVSKIPSTFQVEEKMDFFHEVHEKDALLEANLRKATKLTTKLPYPRNCRQNVPIALAIFYETNTAAIQSSFPE